MASIAQTAGGINALDPPALTRVLDRAERTVTAVEWPPRPDEC